MFQVKLLRGGLRILCALSLEFGCRYLVTYVDCKLLLKGTAANRGGDRMYVYEENVPLALGELS